jgi:hypothetical protein
MAGVTYNPGMEQLRTDMCTGGMTGTIADMKAFMKALSGDIVLKVTPATATPAPTSAAWSQSVVVSLETADGERHKWYSGPVTLAVADTSTAGTAAISPAAGAHYMTDGALTVTLSGNAAAWLNAETATLTATAVAQQGLLNVAISATTCVLTFTT